MYRSLRTLFSLFCLAGLAACSTTISSDYKLPTDKKVGIAFGSITHEGSFYSGGSYQVAVMNIDSAERFRFESGSQGGPGRLFTPSEDASFKVPGATFAVELPAGNYQIIGWRASGGAVTHGATLPFGVPFKVEAGRSVYVGNLHFAGSLRPFASLMQVTLKDEALRDMQPVMKRFPVIGATPMSSRIIPGTQLPLERAAAWGADLPQVYTAAVP